MKSVQKQQFPGQLKELSLCIAMALPMVAMAQDVAGTLPAVRVEAQVAGETTEGTGSYTTGVPSNTATPLGLSLRETPQSVSVVTQQRIEDQGMQTVMDVVNNATGVSVNRYETSRAQFNARGFEINSLMIDGVPSIWSQQWSSGEVFSSLSMYDRVEIVRGANGLMTGAGDPSASINLVHKRARSKVLTGSVEMSGGTWNTYGAQADISSALNESGSVRGRVVAEYSDGDSWIDLHANQRQSLYATMDIDLTPSSVLWFGVSRQANEADAPMWGGLPTWYADGSRTNWGRSKTTAADWTRWDTVHENYFANFEHRLDSGWLARASYSYGDREADSYLLYVSGNPDRVNGTGMSAFAGSYLVKTKQDDASLQASGPFNLAGRTHEAAFGYVYSKQKFNADSRTADAHPAVGDFNDWDGSVPEPNWSSLSFYQSGVTKQQGLYGVARFSLTDPLKLIVGTRFNRYEKTGSDLPDDINKDAVTPYAGVVFDVADNISTYVSYTDIFLPQSERNIDKQTLDPIVGKSTEIGVKGAFIGGRLNTSAAVFHIKQDGLAKATGVNIPGTTNEMSYEASEGATSQGFEFEVSGQIVSGWNASMGYTKFNIEDADGKDINTLYPRQLLRVFSTYRLPAELNRLTVGGGVNWQSRIYTVDPNVPGGGDGKFGQKAYSLVNLMARYDVSKQVSAQLNVNNATDEKYFDVFDAYGALTYGAPRSVTASVKYVF